MKKRAVKSAKKFAKVMREYAAGELASGKKGRKVTSPAQAKAIAASESGIARKGKRR